MTLESAPYDQALRVSSLEGVDETEKARLSGLGLRAGADVVKLMATPLGDPVACLVGSQILAIERRLLARVEVARP